jgi:hypothetical protein
MKEVIFLRRRIPLNMIMLTCTALNDLMLKIVTDLRQYIVDYFINTNRNHNREYVGIN